MLALAQHYWKTGENWDQGDLTYDASLDFTALSRGLMDYEAGSIEGWTVHINATLLNEQPKQTGKAIELLPAQLKEIVRVVPERFGAEYHPDVGWLREHGRDVRMAKCVELTNVRIFEAECRRMPCFVLHQLAHAYHDQVLGFDQADIIAAYKHALAGKRYDAVERWNGHPPNTVERV